MHYAFLDTEAGSGYGGSYLGELKVLTIGGGVAYEPKAVYKNVSPAGALLNNDTVDYTAYAADMLFEYPTAKYGTPTVNAQYLKMDFQDAYKTNLNAGRPAREHRRAERAEGRRVPEGRVHPAGEGARHGPRAALRAL